MPADHIGRSSREDNRAANCDSCPKWDTKPIDRHKHRGPADDEDREIQEQVLGRPKGRRLNSDFVSADGLHGGNVIPLIHPISMSPMTLFASGAGRNHAAPDGALR